MSWFFITLTLKKYNFTYTYLSNIQTKEKLFWLSLLQYENFYVDLRINIGMKKMKTKTWIPLILHLENLYHFCVIIKASNATFLHQHFKNIKHDHNFQMSYILCFIETKIHLALIDVHKFINSSKY
jgi:hypothetical protein